jgi:hypothetical protein
MAVTTFKKSGGTVAQSGAPTDVANFNVGSSGTVILDDENDSVTLGFFGRDDDVSSTTTFFSDQMPNDVTVHGIEVQVGAVHLSSGNFTTSNAFKTTFQVLNTQQSSTAGVLQSQENNWAETGTTIVYDGSDHLTYYNSGTVTDPASFNFTFGGANNLLGLSSLNYNQYNILGLKITFIDESITPGADSRIASRLFSHGNGPSPAIRLHYSEPTRSKIHIIGKRVKIGGAKVKVSTS